MTNPQLLKCVKTLVLCRLASDKLKAIFRPKCLVRPGSAYWYATQVAHDQSLPDVERVIAQDYNYSCFYCSLLRGLPIADKSEVDRWRLEHGWAISFTNRLSGVL